MQGFFSLLLFWKNVNFKLNLGSPSFRTKEEPCSSQAVHMTRFHGGRWHIYHHLLLARYAQWNSRSVTGPEFTRVMACNVIDDKRTLTCSVLDLFLVSFDPSAFAKNGSAAISRYTEERVIGTGFVQCGMLINITRTSSLAYFYVASSIVELFTVARHLIHIVEQAMMTVYTVSLVFLLSLRAVDAQSSYVFPKAINATTGSVFNAEALLAPNSSVATLSGKGAQIVFDYGVNVGGFPTLWLHNVEGESVQMAATYSEGVYECLFKSYYMILIHIIG